MDTYLITDGLDATDYIAFPEDTLKEGMTCTQYEDIESDVDEDTVMQEESTTETGAEVQE